MKGEAAVLIADRIDLKKQRVLPEIKRNNKENKTNIKVHVPKNRPSKYKKQTLT